MHIRISSFYEYHDLAYKIFKIVIFMLSRQQKVPRHKFRKD